MLLIEGFNLTERVGDGFSGFPRVVFLAVPFPFDQVLEFAMVDACIEDFLDFILFFLIDDYRRRFGGFSVRDDTGCFRRAEAIYVEHRVPLVSRGQLY